MRKILAAWALCCVAAMAVRAQQGAPVRYRVSFENAVHHEARVTATFSDVGESPLVFRMSRSSPGRYAIHEFAKNVYAVEAVDGAGRKLRIERQEPYSWRAEGRDGTVTVTFTLFANRGDGTYSQIDPTHAHLNLPATLMWAEGLEGRPAELTFDVGRREWEAATQLPRGNGRLQFTAPNLQYLMDSPVELSAFGLREWQIGAGDNRQTVRLALHHDGIEQDLDIFAEKARKVVDEHVRMFGEAPRFDHGVYTFLADYLPYVTGDGMEHRNSTVLTSAESLYANDFKQLGTLSHEFFHAWNVERLRPAELEPFDFTRANPTPSLWFAEGFTSYYAPLAIHRAGEGSLKDFLADINRRFDPVLNTPGRQFASPKEMSLRAPFVDAATAIDPTNNANTFISYYSYGAVLAMTLDLSIRQKFEGLSLDDYMRAMWRDYGRVEKPYAPDDLRRALAAVTGDEGFANAFFAQSIDGSALPDLEPLLAQGGLELRRKHAGAAWLGKAELEAEGKAMTLAANTLIGNPLYEAGLDRGDRIVRVGRFEIQSEDDWKNALERHRPGDKVAIVFRRRGVEREADITFVEDPTLEVAAMDADRLTDAQKAFREAWLGPER
ncbi:MAG: M61 family metallopeptidase [Bryobacterales bacterium]|nr:M61 family metallopeptidase [Acidobacteriota bacterium]MCB9383988.1 M61 family metallopeptidase [Bryobacterales bacterium]